MKAAATTTTTCFLSPAQTWIAGSWKRTRCYICKTMILWRLWKHLEPLLQCTTAIITLFLPLSRTVSSSKDSTMMKGWFMSPTITWERRKKTWEWWTGMEASAMWTWKRITSITGVTYLIWWMILCLVPLSSEHLIDTRLCGVVC